MGFQRVYLPATHQWHFPLPTHLSLEVEMPKKRRESAWFKPGEKFVGITHLAIDRLNFHQHRTKFPPKPIGKMKGELSIDARWLAVTMAKRWDRRNPEKSFTYPIRNLGREIGWSNSKVSKKIKELLDAEILIRTRQGGLYRRQASYKFNLSFMGVPGSELFSQKFKLSEVDQVFDRLTR